VSVRLDKVVGVGAEVKNDGRVLMCERAGCGGDGFWGMLLRMEAS